MGVDVDEARHQQEPAAFEHAVTGCGLQRAPGRDLGDLPVGEADIDPGAVDVAAIAVPDDGPRRVADERGARCAFAGHRRYS